VPHDRGTALSPLAKEDRGRVWHTDALLEEAPAREGTRAGREGESVLEPRAVADRVSSPARIEALGLVMLVGLVLLYWFPQYQPFLLPNNDYYSFERVAASFAAGELPSDFKRMPIFPACMALLAPIMPGPHPYLHAALVVNQVFAVATLVLLYLLAARTFGAGALAVPLLFSFTLQFHAMGLQPLVEPSLGFFVVLAFLLFVLRSPWQYAAAFGAALSRYDAAAVIPVLFAANVWREGRLGRHLALAALAGSGVVGWTLLGMRGGAGSGFYLELMEGMGFQPAFDFFVRSATEPFRGWYVNRWWMLPVFLGAAGFPVALGLAAGWRRFRVETLALAGFWLLAVAVVVLFGINKARYVYGTQWVPLFFWVAGVMELVRLAGRVAAPRLPAAAGRLLLGAGLLLSGAALAVWLYRIVGSAPARATPLDLAWLAAGLVLALAAAGSIALRVGPTPAWRAALLAGMALAVSPLLGGGLHAKIAELFKIYHANHSAVVLAAWLEEHLEPDQRMVLLPRGHILFLTSAVRREQLEFYASLDAEDAGELAERMRERRIEFAAFTEHGSQDNPAQVFYYEAKRQELSEIFMGGGPVPGFEHVATLPLPEELEREPVQVYRVAPAEG
jgi:hypothetical protein